MKFKIIILIFCGYLQLSECFLTPLDFDTTGLKECYSSRIATISTEVVNGQDQPLPSAIETFISLVEKIESIYPSMTSTDIIKNLLTSFRADELQPEFKIWPSSARYSNEFERVLFGISDTFSYPWKEDDFSNDEKCALHFMLSHTVNTSSTGKPNDEELLEDGTVKQPREYGVVSLHGRWKHAFSLGKVLLGVYAGLLGNNQLDAAVVYQRLKSKPPPSLANTKFSRLFAVTLGDLVSSYVMKKQAGESIEFLPNGMWNDAACTTTYVLRENNKKKISYSLLRGAIDGLLIGLGVEAKPEVYKKISLSQILRMYYGPTGLVDDLDATIRGDIQWCNRERNLQGSRNWAEELFNFHKLYSNYAAIPVVAETATDEINNVFNYIRGSAEILQDMITEASSECGASETSADRRCTTPFDILAITDMGTQDLQKNFQIEVLGNLSNNFNVRPRGNTVSVYTNFKPPQRGLHTIVNSTGITGCQSCYLRYYEKRGGTKSSDVELFQDLNETLSTISEEYDRTHKENLDVKTAAPAKVVLLFSYGNPVEDWRLRDAVWDIEKNFREVTILAIGNGKDNLKPFTINDDTDIFPVPSNAANAADFSTKLKTRICKVPAEFRFPDCHRSSRGTEAENRQFGFIGVNKKQYYAMYPKYFLKSFYINLKFKALDSSQIKVCYTRYYYRLIEDNSPNVYCLESSGNEIKFEAKNPCHRRNAQNCDPFYFSVEGKKAPSIACDNAKCSSPKDIQFEFTHEGISCNSASHLCISLFSMFIALFLILHRH